MYYMSFEHSHAAIFTIYDTDAICREFLIQPNVISSFPDRRELSSAIRLDSLKSGDWRREHNDSDINAA